MMTEGMCQPSNAAELAAQVAEIKELRRQLTAIERVVPQGSRPLSIVHTKLEEAVMWLGKELRRLDDLNPYPTSSDPTVATVDPIADELK